MLAGQPQAVGGFQTFCMKQVQVTTRSQWRRWLAENYDREKNGIWLVFSRKETGRPSLEYGESVEEALCFGWIDSIIKRIDDGRYCRKFTPRKDGSRWSVTNKRRVERITKEGRMTEFGLAKIEAAQGILGLACERRETRAQIGRTRRSEEAHR